MQLEGSCHCKAVTFRVESPHPYPFNICYCGICRKTAGSGGFAINLGGRNETLEVEGNNHIHVYRVRLDDGAESPLERHFCRDCGTMLWVWDPRWPELIHPFASAIDTNLPIPPERTHLMNDFKPSWVADAVSVQDKIFGEYPDESIAEWHERLKLAQ